MRGSNQGIYRVNLTSGYHTSSDTELIVRAKYKKFGTRAEADEFIGEPNSSSAPARAFEKKKDDDFMLASATSALTLATVSSLPPNLAAIATKGYSFTAAPHHLIVYTDGSSLSNGKVGARAGLGVYYGYGGEAVDSNISERVPGILQTNNRGELLVSCLKHLLKCDSDVHSQ
jgi:ribonuclease HI